MVTHQHVIDMCRYLPMAYFAVGAPIGLLIGYLADKTIRLVLSV